MICPSCYGPSRIARTLDTGTEVTRIHECLSVECDSVWTTDQKLRTGSLRRNRRVIRRHGEATNGISDATAPPSGVSNPSASTNGAGGVGGGLPSGIGQVRIQDPSLSNSVLDRRAPAPVPFKPRPMVHLAAATPDFKRVYDRYPNKYRMQQAAQVFQDLALTWPGGERALADDIVAAFDKGMLTRHPYSSTQNHRPKLEDVLAEARWLEPPSDPDGAAADETRPQRDARLSREAAERTQRSLDRDVANTAATLTTCPVHLYGPREDRKCNKRCPMWEGPTVPDSSIRTLAENKAVARG